MGMAASQARFLGLTARKTNTEYEGQQVNQQRTALSNESAGLFNQMLTLNVPVPPSATDYYSMRYTYEASGQSYEITNYSAGTVAGAYDVTVRTSYDVVNYTAVKLNSDPTTQITQTLHKNADGTYYMTFGSSTTEYAVTGPTTNAVLIQSGIVVDKDGKVITDETTPFYSYNRDGANYYMTQADIERYLEGVSSFDGEMNAYRQDNSKKVEDKTYNNCNLIADSTGKFQYITLPDGTQYALNLEEVTDDKGYDEAMQKYNYEKMKYDKTISDINAKTEKIQAQDRALELRLKQLDTEQEALQTEMEAVKKVIDKNVENTFKTFA